MYSDYGDYGWGALVAFWLIVAPILLLFAVAGYVIGSLFLMRVFDKAGVQGKWRAWVPVYNAMVFAKLGDVSPWVMLGAILVSGILGQIQIIGWIFSLAALAVAVMVGWRAGLKLGKDWPYLLLWLIPGLGMLIWLGILAYSSSSWNPNIAPSPWRRTFLRDATVWQGIPVQPDAAGAAPGYGAPGYGAPGYGAPGYGAPGAYPPAGYAAAPAADPQAPAYPPPGGYPQQPPGYAPPPAPPAYEPPANVPPANEPPVYQPPASGPEETPAASGYGTAPASEEPAPRADAAAPATEPAEPAVEFGEPATETADAASGAADPVAAEEPAIDFGERAAEPPVAPGSDADDRPEDTGKA